VRVVLVLYLWSMTDDLIRYSSLGRMNIRAATWCWSFVFVGRRFQKSMQAAARRVQRNDLSTTDSSMGRGQRASGPEACLRCVATRTSTAWGAPTIDRFQRCNGLLSLKGKQPGPGPFNFAVARACLRPSFARSVDSIVGPVFWRFFLKTSQISK
jgi:hypothetical protein